MPYYARLPR